MSKLLKDALIDARAVKNTALANAKSILEEAFQPALQRVISAKLNEEDEDFEDELEDQSVETSPHEEPDGDEGTGMEEFESEFEMDDSEDDDVELESLIRELEGEEDELTTEGQEEDWSEPIEESDDEDVEPIEESDDEDVSDEELYEMIMSELNDEEDLLGESEDGGGSYEKSAPKATVNTENRKLKVENKKLRKQYAEALSVVSKLKSTINEVNLLNAKLMYNTKVNKKYTLSANQKTAVLESIDRANTVREVKLVYSTICEAMNKVSQKSKKLNEGYASKGQKMVKPTSKPHYDFVPRWQELANIKKS